MVIVSCDFVSGFNIVVVVANRQSRWHEWRTNEVASGLGSMTNNIMVVALPRPPCCRRQQRGEVSMNV